jgi:3-deoxy-D-manno-octulosonic-acid transferase
LLTSYINTHETPLKWIIAPHNIKESHILKLRDSLPNETILMSEIKNQKLSDYKILIVDNVGLLTKIYSYASMAYVGGGFATGLHNTLEPAVFGVPIIIGPEYQNFKEATALVERKGIIVVSSQQDLDSSITKLTSDLAFREKTGKINATYVEEKLGATQVVLDFIKTCF